MSPEHQIQEETPMQPKNKQQFLEYIEENPHQWDPLNQVKGELDLHLLEGETILASLEFLNYSVVDHNRLSHRVHVLLSPQRLLIVELRDDHGDDFFPASVQIQAVSLKAIESVTSNLYHAGMGHLARNLEIKVRRPVLSPIKVSIEEHTPWESADVATETSLRFVGGCEHQDSEEHFLRELSKLRWKANE